VTDSRKSIAVDTGVFVALLSSKERAHKACLNVLSQLPGTTTFFTTEACLTETSFLLGSNAQLRSEWQKLIELLQIAIVPLDGSGLVRVFELLDKYHDLPMDLADATLVVACEKLGARTVFTLDRTDFSIYRPKHCRRFDLLPAE